MNKLEGQMIYCGPTIPGIGLLKHDTIFRNGIHERHTNIYSTLQECPAIASLFVPATAQDYGAVKRELNFDIAGNMRGTVGKYVTFYQTVKKWLESKARAAVPRTA